MIFLGVGTNLGDKEENIRRAYMHLEEAGVNILRKSSIYSSKAWGIRNQASFLNSVIEVEFTGTPLALLDICLSVETKMGRERIVKWGPRLIDLDIIDFDRISWKTGKLILPHAFYTERSFVLTPLAELEPDWVDVESGKSIQYYLEQISDEDACIRIEDA